MNVYYLLMIIIKYITENKSMILDHINENDTITIQQLKHEIFQKYNIHGRLLLCGKILNDQLKLNQIKHIYQYWNGKIIFL